MVLLVLVLLCSRAVFGGCSPDDPYLGIKRCFSLSPFIGQSYQIRCLATIAALE